MELNRHFTTDLEVYLALDILPDGVDLDAAKKIMDPYIATSAVIKRALELAK